MMKVRILDRCEFCDGELSMREARCLTAIDLARCVMAVIIVGRRMFARVL